MHLHTTEINPNLKSISENVHEKSRFFYIIESRATRHSDVSAFTETVEFLERSLASMFMRYCCSMIGWLFLIDIIGSQKHIATYNFHIK